MEILAAGIGTETTGHHEQAYDLALCSRYLEICTEHVFLCGCDDHVLSFVRWQEHQDINELLVAAILVQDALRLLMLAFKVYSGMCRLIR